MATGLLATIFAALRLFMFLGHFQDQGMVRIAVRGDLLCGLELMVATIAASLPCLKAPTQRVLHHFGVLHSSSTIACVEQMSFDSHFRDQVEELPLKHFGGSHDGPQTPRRADM